MLLRRLLQPALEAPTVLGVPGDNKACVCLIFRLRGKHQSGRRFGALEELRGYLEEHQSSEGTQDGEEEQLLFIRRAHNPRDRWSGHIAFPGGRVNAGEGEYDAAVRECREEIGLDLLSSRFAYIGRLNDRAARGSRKALIISPFVFVQLDTSPEITLKLQASEVQEAFWVQTRQLHSCPIDEVRMVMAKAAAPFVLLLGLIIPFAQAFIRPVVPVRAPVRLYSSKETDVSKPSVGTLLSPLAGRQVELFETEDSTERFIQVTFMPDGTFNQTGAENTNAVGLLGTWAQSGEGKVTFVLERLYAEGTTRYSMTRVYEGEFIQSGRSIRGEGKVEQEKYGDMITCGYFSLITMDDGPDEVFDQIRHRDATDGMIEGLDF